MHIRHCILYEFKKSSKASQAARNIRSAYKNEAPNIRTYQRWFKQFESGKFTLEDFPWSGGPSSVNLDVLKAVVEKNPKQTARELAKQFSTYHRTIITLLNKLGKVSIYGQRVPHNLTANQLAQIAAICSSLRIRFSRDPFLNRILSNCDKTFYPAEYFGAFPTHSFEILFSCAS